MKKKQKIVPPTKPQITQEKAYQKQLMRFGRAMALAVNTEVLPFLKEQQAQYVIDSITKDSFADQINSLLNNLKKKFTGLIEAGFAKVTASNMVKSVSTANSAKFNRSIARATGVDLSSVVETEGLTNFKELSINKNISLINSLPQQYLTQVETIINNGVANGTRYSEIAKQITSKTGANDKLKNRIKVIATNEIQTINAQLNLRRAESLGIKKGIYRTSGKNNVRKCHKELDGMEYDLKKGAWSKTCQRFIQPGEDINCACTFSPVIEL